MREVAAASRWTVHTEVFDGPLDLLLYLAKRDGIDLKRLVVSVIADSYMAYLDRMRDLNLSVAGDYLVMAATLVHLKSLELLPRMPTLVEEDGEDPRAVLERQLAEYARYREASESLETRPWIGRDVFVREPVARKKGEEIVAGVDPFGLLDIYYDLLNVAEEPEPVIELVGTGPDFRGCCEMVLDALVSGGGKAELGRLLRSLGLRSTRVITFLAVLESARLGWIDIEQAEHLGPVELRLRAPRSEIDLDAITGWVESPGEVDE